MGKREKGMLIAFAGLPCSGKSTLTKSLGEQLNKPFFLEPEEDAWPLWITQKNSDQFSALNWFRSARVPIYKMASESSKATLTLIDSFYDVLIYYYLENSAFSWLISPENPYFEIIKKTATLDAKLLPKPDLLVFLRLDEQCWKHFLDSRGRAYDEAVDIENYFHMQYAILEAVKQYCIDNVLNYIIIDQEVNNISGIKNKILNELTILKFV